VLNAVDRLLGFPKVIAPKTECRTDDCREVFSSRNFSTEM
jgi:hypothetical protein